MRGTFALVGSGEYLPPMNAVDHFLLERLDRPARVACLPTVAGTEGEDRIRYWSELGMNHFTLLGAQVESLRVIDRKSANNPELAERIRACNFIYLSGGNPIYLLNTLQDSLVWTAIRGVVDEGGALVGCSAGAMVMGERIAFFPSSKEAFKFLPQVVVLPHFDEMPSAMVRIVKTFLSSGFTLLGVEGNTALACSATEKVVVGSGGVTVWNRHIHRRFTNGEALPLFT